MTERIRDLIKEGFELKEIATIILGFAYNEKAIFCVKGGKLKIFPTEDLNKEQVQALHNCWTVGEMEEIAQRMGITKRETVVEEGIFYDDIFVLDTINGVVKLYEVKNIPS